MIGSPGQIAVHRDGHAIVLGRRTDDDTGWLLAGHRDGGIADSVLESDDWTLIDLDDLRRWLAGERDQ